MDLSPDAVAIALRYLPQLDPIAPLPFERAPFSTAPSEHVTPPSGSALLSYSQEVS